MYRAREQIALARARRIIEAAVDEDDGHGDARRERAQVEAAQLAQGLAARRRPHARRGERAARFRIGGSPSGAREQRVRTHGADDALGQRRRNVREPRERTCDAVHRPRAAAGDDAAEAALRDAGGGGQREVAPERIAGEDGPPGRRGAAVATSSAISASAASRVNGSSAARLPWPGRSGAQSSTPGGSSRRSGSQAAPFAHAPWSAITRGPADAPSVGSMGGSSAGDSVRCILGPAGIASLGVAAVLYVGGK